MVRCSRLRMVLGALPLMSCGDDIFDEFARKPGCDTLDTDGVCREIHGSSGTTATPTSTASTSTSEGTTLTTHDPTGTDAEESGTSAMTGGGDSPDDRPDLEHPLTAKLTAWPSPVLQVGTVNLTLAVQGPAVSVDLYD